MAVFGARENKVELRDVAVMTVLQGVGYIPSLAVLPYLMVVLGAERFGHVGFALSLCVFFMIVVDFGFNLSATKRIALVRDDKDEVNRIFWSAFFCKMVLLALCFGIMLLVSLVPQYAIYRPAMLAKFVTVVGDAFLFIFLFQGLGYIRWVYVFDCVAKLTVLPLTFWLVKSPDDYLIAAALPGIATLVEDALLMGLALKRKWLKLPSFSFKACTEELKAGFPIFLSNVSCNLYLLLLVLALGYFSTAAEVGKFTASDKIVRALITLLFMPVVKVFYPTASRMATESLRKAKQLVNKLLLLEIGVMLLAVGAVVAMTPYLPLWLGEDYAGTGLILGLLAVMALFYAAGGVCSQLGLLALGGDKQKRQYTYVYIAAFALCAIATFLLVPNYAATGAAFSILLTETAVAVAMAVLFMRKQ